MAKTMHNPISIEKFAAYLDGNLSIEETQDVAGLIMNDSALSELLAVNTAVDYQMQQMENDGYALPDDLANMEFDYPHLDATTEFPNLDGIETLLIHEDYSVEPNNLGTNNEDTSLFSESDGLSGNVGYSNYPFSDNNSSSSDNDSIADSGMQLDFLNND